MAVSYIVGRFIFSELFSRRKPDSDRISRVGIKNNTLNDFRLTSCVRRAVHYDN